MSTNMALVDLHGRALDAATAVVDRLSVQELALATPCAGWRVADLLGHMIGQHLGFARAVAEGDAELVDFRPLPGQLMEGLIQRWHDSTRKLRAAFTAATGGEAIRLVEIDEQRTFELSSVLGIHILDTAVHTWDLATAVRRSFRPDADVLACVGQVADQVPGGHARTVTSAFGQPVPVDSPDRWIRVLAHLGRSAPPSSVGDTDDEV